MERVITYLDWEPTYVKVASPSNHSSSQENEKGSKREFGINGSDCGTGFQKARSFLTKEERIGLLKGYKDDLEKERDGVVERIKELEAS